MGGCMSKNSSERYAQHPQPTHTALPQQQNLAMHAPQNTMHIPPNWTQQQMPPHQIPVQNGSRGMQHTGSSGQLMPSTGGTPSQAHMGRAPQPNQYITNHHQSNASMPGGPQQQMMQPQQMAKVSSAAKISTSSRGSISGAPLPNQPPGGVRDSPSRTPNRVYIAMFDYHCQTDDDLAFKKNDLMEVDNTSGEWWMATHLTTKKRGFIPSNYVEPYRSHKAEPWFLGEVTRLSAECMLREYGRGTFLVRNAESRRDEFSLSVRDDPEVKHYRIKMNDDGMFFIAKRSPFPTLVELIEHYKQHGDGLCVRLTTTIEQAEAPTRTLQSLSKSHELNWEIQYNQLEFGPKLGSGQFGEVFRGTWMKQKEVAIKTLKAGTMDKEDFRRESNIMKKLKHRNLVALYGVCVDPLLIVTELAKHGNVLDYFKKNEGRLIFKDLVMMGSNVAAGMAYLERNAYVHRDLAARNILVHRDKPLTCKIGDFGLARKLAPDNLYDAHQGAKFPIKWTAPEAATKNVFTTKSDVWSFGVLFFEICTKGRQPYAGMTNADVLREVERGYRMPKVDCIEPKAYELMKQCWNADPNKRPTFESLKNSLDDYYTSNEGENYNDDVR